MASDNNGSKFLGFYSSQDAGVTWTTVSDENTSNMLGYSTTGSDESGQGWYDLCIEAHPTQPGRGHDRWRQTSGNPPTEETAGCAVPTGRAPTASPKSTPTSTD